MTRPEISLGLARRSDALAIATISRDLIEYGLQWSWTPERVAASIRRSRTIVVVARAADRIAGFGIMRYGDDQAHLDLLAVAADQRRAGLGRRLVEWLEKPALMDGISTVFVEVRESNQAARAFYRHLGYRPHARLSGYYQGRESALRLRHELGTRARLEPDVWARVAELLQAAGIGGPTI